MLSQVLEVAAAGASCISISACPYASPLLLDASFTYVWNVECVHFRNRCMPLLHILRAQVDDIVAYVTGQPDPILQGESLNQQHSCKRRLRCSIGNNTHSQQRRQRPAKILG